MLRRYFTALVCAFILTFLVMGTQSQAQRVTFRYTGGRWSHTRHTGWHRYWGGPTVGYYYAPYPVYVVRGYESPTYYSGPTFWYSNPSFGLRINSDNGRTHRYHRRYPRYPY
jgi:hypothetical protein